MLPFGGLHSGNLARILISVTHTDTHTHSHTHTHTHTHSHTHTQTHSHIHTQHTHTKQSSRWPFLIPVMCTYVSKKVTQGPYYIPRSLLQTSTTPRPIFLPHIPIQSPAWHVAVQSPTCRARPRYFTFPCQTFYSKSITLQSIAFAKHGNIPAIHLHSSTSSSVPFSTLATHGNIPRFALFASTIFVVHLNNTSKNGRMWSKK